MCKCNLNCKLVMKKINLASLRCYLVGGAVRDQLLGRTVRERDWVVVGADTQQLIALGFTQVGKDFPVFLHPQTKEEYALARTERKQGHGYHGFSVDAGPHIRLEEDLLRRDLTINAIAQDAQGQLMDPFGGQDDLKAKRLRHVSLAFSEDPLRVLRLARFAAQFPDFTIDDETIALCQEMVRCGEVAHLTRERVWQEWQKALSCPAPWRFIDVLAAIGAWAVIMPECLYPNKDSRRLERLTRSIDPQDRQWLFCAIGLDLAEARWVEQLRLLALPKYLSELSVMVHQLVHDGEVPSSTEHVLAKLHAWDALRRYERFNHACVISRHILNDEKLLPPWEVWAKELRNIRPEGDVIQGLSGLQIAAHVKTLRIQWLMQKCGQMK